MNKKPITHVAFILDKSGSMARTAKQAVDGFNSQLEEIKQNSKDQDIRVSVVSFATNVYENMWEQSAEDLQAATYESFKPLGWTALWDAMVYTIDKLSKTTDAEDPDTTYLVVVISDGEEWNSKHFTVENVRNLVTECESTGQWTFTYMGCSEAMLNRLASATGIKPSNMAKWDNSTAGGTVAAFDELRRRTRGYFVDKFQIVTNCRSNVGGSSLSSLSGNFYSDNSAESANFCAENVTMQSTLNSCSLDKSDIFEKGEKVDFSSCHFCS